MRPSTHLMASVLAGLALYPQSPQRIALLSAAGVLIDLDHYVLYGLRSGDWRPGGALSYNRYRNRPLVPGDTRPRYGSLRSWLHNPLCIPLALVGAWRWRGLRPVAAGFILHLVLDYSPLPFYVAEHIRARGRCSWCGRKARLRIRSLSRKRISGSGARRHYAVCQGCFERYLCGVPDA